MKVKLNANVVLMVLQNIPSTSNFSNLSEHEKKLIIYTPKNWAPSFRYFENSKFESIDIIIIISI